MKRCLFAVVVLAAACSRGGSPGPLGPGAPRDGDLAAPAGTVDLGDGGAPSLTDAGGIIDGNFADAAGRIDAAAAADLRPADLASAPDLAPFMGVLTVKIFASNTCKVTTEPASISVPRGSTFTVNWQNLPTSSYAVDVDKRDAFNLVSIVIGLGAGMSHHDTVRPWCGIFTGTFFFRVRTACGQYEIPVNCSA
jgi:hypothetical protein